jgi:hypothetical protein
MLRNERGARNREELMDMYEMPNDGRTYVGHITTSEISMIEIAFTSGLASHTVTRFAGADSTPNGDRQPGHYPRDGGPLLADEVFFESGRHARRRVTAPDPLHHSRPAGVGERAVVQHLARLFPRERGVAELPVGTGAGASSIITPPEGDHTPRRTTSPAALPTPPQPAPPRQP